MDVDVWLAERWEDVRKALERGDPEELESLLEELGDDIRYFERIIDDLEEMKGIVEEKLEELKAKR